MKIYLVEDCGYSPGKIWVCLASQEDAEYMKEIIKNEQDTDCQVVERTLFYGQPSNKGFNL